MAIYLDSDRSSSDSLSILNDLLLSSNGETNVPDLVIDVILTIIGCILLKIDHRSKVQRFSDILSERSLDIFRNDLENWLHFEKRDVTSLILDFFKIRAVRKQENTWSKKEYRLSDGSTSRKMFVLKKSGKNAVRRAVWAVIRFLIFRRTKLLQVHPQTQLTKSYDNGHLGRTISVNHAWTNERSCFGLCEKSGKVEETCWKCPSLLLSIEDEEMAEEQWKASRGQKTRELSGKVIPCSQTKAIDIKKHDLNSDNWNCEDDQIVETRKSSHACKKIYCLLCYGWMWIPISYVCIITCPIIMELTYNVFNILSQLALL